jgi:hypothetical protein
MPSFNKGGGVRPAFGKNVYQRSTKGQKFESYTFSRAATPNEQIDGEAKKFLQSGEVMAKITSGPESGKVGPFQAGVTDGRQTTANIVGIAETFLPWELNERDHDGSVCYEVAARQGWCFERNAAGDRIPLTNATRDAIVDNPALDVYFK